MRSTVLLWAPVLLTIIGALMFLIHSSQLRLSVEVRYAEEWIAGRHKDAPEIIESRLESAVNDWFALYNSRGEEVLQRLRDEIESAHSDEFAIAMAERQTDEVLARWSKECVEDHFRNPLLNAIHAELCMKHASTVQQRRNERQLAEKKRQEDERARGIEEVAIRNQILHEQQLAKDREAVREMASLARANRLDDLVSLGNRAIREHPESSRVHLHATLAFLKANRIDAALECGKKCLLLLEKQGTGLQLTNRENAALHSYLGAAYASRQEMSNALRDFEAAAKLDDAYSLHVALAKKYFDNLEPTPDSLARATVVSNAESLGPWKSSFPIDGVLRLTQPAHDEVRCSILGILRDNSVVAKCQGPRGEMILYRFPASDVGSIYRSNDVEIFRYEMLTYAGFDPSEYFSTGVHCLVYIAEERKWAGMKTVKTGRRHFTSSSFSNALPFGDVMRIWRQEEKDSRGAHVPYTWTREWAKEMRDRPVRGELIEYAKLMNLPRGKKNPYPRLPEAGSLERELESLSIGLTFLAATSQQFNRWALSERDSQGRPTEKSPLARGMQIYADMSPRERQQLVDGVRQIAVVGMVLYGMGQEQAFPNLESGVTESGDHPALWDRREGSQQPDGGSTPTGRDGGIPVRADLRNLGIARPPRNDEKVRYAVEGPWRIIGGSYPQNGELEFTLVRSGFQNIWFHYGGEAHGPFTLDYNGVQERYEVRP
ncbi:MAG: hypothetical protein O3C40_30705 [Planctomycetota bacterium]|nr:hypothetical protein [Planctomycetota bacterium]